MGGYDINQISDTHELKIFPEYLEAILDETKTFEVRKNDRNYKVNDILMLKEWNKDKGYTGRWITVKICYILDNPDYCKDGFIILGIKLDY